MNTFSPDDVVWIGKCDLPCEDHYGRVERQIDTHHCGVWVPMGVGGTPRFFIVHIFAMLHVGRHESYQEQKVS